MITRNNNGIFILENDKVVINPKALMIPEFNALWRRDMSIGKKKANRELAYVYYMADYRSEYNVYGLGKESQIAFDLFGDKKYKPDPLVQEAIEKYKVLQETPSMRYLLSMRQRVNNIIDYLDNAQIKDKKKNKNEDGTMTETFINPFLTINPIISAMGKLEETIESIEKWEKKVFDEDEDMKIRGGGDLNVFEDPESAKRWLGNKQ